MRPPSAAVAACCGCRARLTPATVGPDWQTADHDALDRPDLLLLGLHEYTKSGIGRTSLASTEKYKIIGDRQDHCGGSGTRQDARLFDPQTSAAWSRTSPDVQFSSNRRAARMAKPIELRVATMGFRQSLAAIRQQTLCLEPVFKAHLRPEQLQGP